MRAEFAIGSTTRVAVVEPNKSLLDTCKIKLVGIEKRVHQINKEADHRGVRSVVDTIVSVTQCMLETPGRLLWLVRVLKIFDIISIYDMASTPLVVRQVRTRSTHHQMRQRYCSCAKSTPSLKRLEGYGLKQRGHGQYRVSREIGMDALPLCELCRSRDVTLIRRSVER